MNTIPQADIHIIEGEDYLQPYKIKQKDGTYVDFTDYTAVGHIRESFQTDSR